MTCIIIDDEPHAIAILQRYVEKTDGFELLSSFERPTAVISFLRDHRPDCIFMDVNMPDLDGLQLSRLVRDVPVIFTTAYPQYALESYEVNAADYLLKPIAYPRFLKAVEKVRGLVTRSVAEENGEVIAVKSEGKIYRVKIEDIQYLEKQGNNMVINTDSDKVVSRMTIDEALALLPQKQFIRLHRSFIVACNKIKIVEGHQVTTNTGSKIPVGSAHRDDLKKIVK